MCRSLSRITLLLGQRQRRRTCFNRRFPVAAVPCLPGCMCARIPSLHPHRRRCACLLLSRPLVPPGPTSWSGDTEPPICWGIHPAVQPGSRASATIARARGVSPLVALQARAEEGTQTPLGRSKCWKISTFGSPASSRPQPRLPTRGFGLC